MPTFFARRYMRKLEAIGKTERVLGAVILLLLGGIVATFTLQVAHDEDYLFDVDEAVYSEQRGIREPASTASSSETPPGESAPPEENPFPEPHTNDWQKPRQVSRYTPDNLYEKINGRADAYLQFHVVELIFGTYHHRTDSEQTIDVYWYRMGEPENAFGIYRTEASSEASPVAVGREGYQVGGAVFFWKGSGYLQVLPADLGKTSAEAARRIAERLDGRIEEAGDDFWALNVLPSSRRVPGSFAYIAEDAFGLDFLTEVFTANYDVDGERVTLFIHRQDKGALAQELLEKYTRFFEKYGRVIWTDPSASRSIVAGEVAGMIDVVFAKGRYLGGVAGAKDADAARKAAVTFFAELTGP